ncbi:MAG: starch-binding protein, partial [Muribaculaceae bacterium]|nr:starch-binding protein [Muribaculaceae bacterium]
KDATTDSYALVAISGNATFTGVLNGRYVDAITCDVKQVTDGKLTATCSGKGNMRVYVLDTDKTKAPGKIGTDGKFLYTSTPASVAAPEYDGHQDDGEYVTVKETGGGNNGGGDITEPETPVDPSVSEGEQAVFFENTAGWGGQIYCYIWNGGTEYAGKWPGSAATYLGNDIWKYTYTGTSVIGQSSQLIFNNNSSQTGNMAYVNGGYYNAAGWVKTIPGAGEIVGPEDPDPQTHQWNIYFDITSTQWNAVNCYVWDQGNNSKEYLGKWPGQPMSRTTVNGKEVYGLTFSTDDSLVEPMVIFNSNGQTGNLPLVNNMVYSFDGHTVTAISNIAGDVTGVKAAGGILSIDTTAETIVRIVRIDGVVITRHLMPGHNEITDLADGLYIVCGRKVPIFHNR